MPTVLVLRGFRLFFYSNEGQPPEPIHVHVRKAGGEAKVWLEPQVVVAATVGFTPADVRELLDIVEQHASLVREHWSEHFGS